MPFSRSLSDAEVKFSSLVAPAPQASSLPLSHHMPCGRKKKKRERKSRGTVFWAIATGFPYLLSPPLKKCTTWLIFMREHMGATSRPKHKSISSTHKPPCAPSQQWSTGFSQQRHLFCQKWIHTQYVPRWQVASFTLCLWFTILLYVAFILLILLSRSWSVLQIEKLRLKDFKELAMATRFGQELSPKSNSCLFLLCSRHAVCQLSSLILKPQSLNLNNTIAFTLDLEAGSV